MTETEKLQPGTVFVTRGGNTASFLIRLGAALLDKPNLGNHVAVYHHTRDGVQWGIEGRPGGVGWVDMRRYLSSHWTLSNKGQRLTPYTGAEFCKMMAAVLGTSYDWSAIVHDGFQALHLPELFLGRSDWHGQGVPGHVVCSSYAAWLYAQFGLPHPNPGHERFTTPGDWAEWIINEEWSK